ncbi:23S rRNA (pseudouridine(1915)-N(3))-methyltransferase RlmH [Methylophilaceae bacterium]|mgnify:FL=1|nr:23S rRNA (pseudouridine(1915)-N(3))-methyltransferase RlmH [Methylophilaceae bacterium]NCV28168.1 23S rRNA (pseudouridine(1915)-N(3))-methyltransferase RlmH [Nitrosomonadales bacterium]NCV54292.1 23S rRNA (pseudouridine(1915)-N(3))-methyltransferase RlmH [Betaproteobacteria bacterium]MDC0626432.1 23S rRNA (pseudouridine(1915)-N(3))-methyltransferase RlmH [Methylophilaceae bacterium]NCW62714.1 23S rRNA (pseudouridine(1915)-N(3))-methyltransferase RlmH [Betaproteobacteria bacterium]
MIIKIISIGSQPQKEINQLIESYTQKISAYSKVEWINLQLKLKDKNIKIKKELESQNILSKIDSNAFIVSLDEKGQTFSSVELSQQVEKIMLNHSNINFIIGGADGLDQGILEKSNLVMSLSHLTLPHQLVKVFLIEQIYRSYSIINNLPYHRE